MVCLMRMAMVRVIIVECFVGNFHALLLYKTSEEAPAVYEAGKRIVQRAIDLDGTCESKCASLQELY